MANYIVKFAVSINRRERTMGQVGVIGEPSLMDTNMVQIEIEKYFKKFKGNDIVEVKILEREEVSDDEYSRQLPINLPIGEDI